MKCSKCDAEIAEGQKFCQSCGAPVEAPAQGTQQVPPAQQAQPQASYVPPQPQPGAPVSPVASPKSRTTAGILGILLGGLGIHKFYLGLTTPGIIMLAISIIGSIFSMGIVGGVVWIIGLIEGIIYLTKSDQEFYQTYVVQKKQWF